MYCDLFSAAKIRIISDTAKHHPQQFVTIMTNDNCIMSAGGISGIVTNLTIIIYNIYIIYNDEINLGFFVKVCSRNMTLSFVTFVMLPRAFLFPRQGIFAA